MIDVQAVVTKWEYYLDHSYFDMWAVRRLDDKNFNSDKLFHLMSMEEAVALSDTLNELELWKDIYERTTV